MASKLPKCPLCGAKCETGLRGKVICQNPICEYLVNSLRLHLALCALIAKLRKARGEVLATGWAAPCKGQSYGESFAGRYREHPALIVFRRPPPRCQNFKSACKGCSGRMEHVEVRRVGK